MSGYSVWSYNRFKAIICTFTNGTEMLLSGVFFFFSSYVLFSPMFGWTFQTACSILLVPCPRYCVNERQHMEGEEYFKNIDEAQPG